MRQWIDMEPLRELDRLIQQHLFKSHSTLDPLYSSSLRGVRLVEDEIERRGLWFSYIETLLIDILKVKPPERWMDCIWQCLRATPEQRCRAALAALGVTLDQS